MFEREGRGATAEIMKQGVGALRQRQIPGMPEFEVEEQGPTEANAVEYFGEDVHGGDANPADDPTQYLDDWALPSEITAH